MLVEKTAEYAVGEPKPRLMRRLKRRRKERPMFVALVTTLVPTPIAYGSAEMLGTVLGSWVTTGPSFIGMGVLLAVGLCTWNTAPDFRRDKALKLLWNDQLIDPEDVLYRLVLTDDVMTWLLAEQANGQTNGACKRAVDAFMQEFAPHREQYSKVRKPEESELITEEWEQEHGPLFEHPLVVAIQDAICDNGDLQVHVYDVVMELREKRRAREDEKRRVELASLEADIEELEGKLEQQRESLVESLTHKLCPSDEPPAR